MHTHRLIPALPVLAVLLVEVPMAAQNRLLFIGSQTRLGGKGIYALRMDSDTGALGATNLAAATENPTFIARHPVKDIVYAVNELGGKDTSGAVCAFAASPTKGELSFINKVPAGGKGTCFVSVDRAGAVAFAANYSSGSFCALPIKPDGSLGEASAVIQDQGTGPNPKRQGGAHAHSIKIDPSDHYVFGCDLGIDKVLSWKLDRANGALVANTPPAFASHPGAGPRHFSFHPGGRWAVIANELDSTVTVCRYDAAQGSLTQLAVALALPPEVAASNNTLSEIAFHPNGRFFYTANRGHDSIAVFETGDPETAGYKPRLVEAVSCGGKVPRHFALDPSGRFLISANQNSGNLAVLAVDPTTGRLTATAHGVAVPGASCVLFYD